MELSAPDALGDNNAAIGRAIIGDCCYALLVLRLYIVGMGEIEIVVGRNVVKDGQPCMQWPYLVPAHVRNLRPGRDTSHIPAKEAQAIDLPLGVMVCEQLHAQTDAQERFVLLCRLSNGTVYSTICHARLRRSHRP